MLVEFGSRPSSRWAAEFATGGWTGNRSLIPLPDGRRVVVLAEGNAYLIDPDSMRLDQHLSEFAVAGYCVNEAALFVIDCHGIVFEAYDELALRWRTRRVSWDGIERVSWSRRLLTSDTWSAPEQRWVPATVDLGTGRATGGGYDLACGSLDERLYVGE